VTAEDRSEPAADLFLYVARNADAADPDDTHDGDQLTPPLPPEDCASSSRRGWRSRLTAWCERSRPADRGEAVDLLLNRRRGPCHDAKMSRIAELCGLLPVASRIAGMLLHESPQSSVETFITALADERRRQLGRLRLEGNVDRNASSALSVGERRRARPDLAGYHRRGSLPTCKKRSR
jgi:hypothetical protein